MPVIGTAGHVDHGKSALVLALTGRDPDRWEEEKRRGLTIDLGFAWTALPGGVEVSFVDVPGHERFLKNMLAGIEAIDLALLVVAANEGWMPQTEEHLAVLDLLDVAAGVVALTKADLVDHEVVELMTVEVEERLAGTSLADAPSIPVSTSTGNGIPDLARLLADQAASVDVSSLDRPRVWVDRAFSVTGAGTVVTGTLLDGYLRLGETVTVYPAGVSARIRSLESHEQPMEEVGPGRRVAVGLAGIDRGVVARGAMLGLPGQWDLSSRFTARLRSARYAEMPTSRGAFHLHIGSGAHAMRITRIEDDTCLIETDTLLPMASGDRFILRDVGRRLVVAGGSIIDPAPPPRAKQAMRVARLIPGSATPDQVATALLEARGEDEIQRLAAHSKGGSPSDAIVLDGTALTESRLAEIGETIGEVLADEHRQHPLRGGIPTASLASSLGVTQRVVEELARRRPDLAVDGPLIRLAAHEVTLSEEQTEAWMQARRLLEESGLKVPAITALGLDNELIHVLVRRGELVPISGMIAYLPAQIAEIEGLIRSMSDDFTVAEFRNATGLSRKYAVPVLEWSDAQGLTVRRGDTRRPR